MGSAICIYIVLALYLLCIYCSYKKQQKNHSDALLSEPNGIFKHDKASGITCILSGILLMGLFVFISFKDSEATLSGLLVGLGFGMFFLSVGICFLLFHYKSFFYIDNDHIKGKYHYFGKIDCSIHDVTFASGSNGALMIQLKNGKIHTIVGMENAWQLASIIRKNMPFAVAEQSETLIEELNKLKSARKKGLIYVCSGLAFMFINIFLAAFLTGERELHEFSKNDWRIFTVMGVIECLTVIVTFYFAGRTGKNNLPIEKLKYCIQRTIVESDPLLPGNVIQVFSDENYTGRITLFGYPNDDSVYYTIQEFAADYTFVQSYESEVFANMEQLQDGFEGLIDITDKVLHSRTKAE